MATQTSREDTVGKAMEEQSTQGSIATVTSPSPPAPMETQDIADVDGKGVESLHLCDVCSFFIVWYCFLHIHSYINIFRANENEVYF
jgi:hypothetical protein